MPIKMISALICDEVRQEVTGRAMIIGAAPIGPELNEEGETEISRLGFYVEAEISGIEKLVFRLHSVEYDHTPFEMEMDVPPSSPDAEDQEISSILGSMAFGREDVIFKGPGSYLLQYSTDGKTWKTIREFFFPRRQLVS